ncbi:hypothetical protein BKM35_21955 [Salmonella enterica]|nr:hypothetical protein [Salmonella enterica]
MNAVTQQTTEQRQETPLSWFRSAVDKRRSEFMSALPKDVNADRFIRTLITTAQMRPELLSADHRSLIASCMKAAQDGLMPDGREAVLNVYKTQIGNDWVPMVQYLPMVRGLLKAIRNSGEIAHVDAAAVYEKDHFRFTRGDDPRIEHEPYDGDEEPGLVKAAYVIVRFDNGEIHREVMFRRDIEKVRAASRTSDGPAWRNWYDQMAIKAVIKRAHKLLPSSSERLERVIEHDNEAMGFDFSSHAAADDVQQLPQQQVATIPHKRESRGASRLSGIIGLTSKQSDLAPAQGAAGEREASLSEAEQ